MGETLDPEALHDLVSSAQTTLTEIVTRYGGHVAKYLGDGLMALFGAPIAFEDDAERAVLAALDMHRALAAFNQRRHENDPPLQLRIGITSGEVIAGDMAGTYDVMGDAANTAARLQGAAEVGGILVGEETMGLARRRIRFGDRQALSLKGKAEVVTAYSVIGPRAQAAERWETQERRTPLVGRDEELQHLLSIWERARSGEGQLISVVGDAGVGKSRLVLEVTERIQTTERSRVLRARCLSYGRQTSLSLIGDIVRNLSRVTPQDDPPQVVAKLQEAVTTRLEGQDQESLDAAVDVLGTVLGLPALDPLIAGAGPQARRQILIRTLRLLLARAERTPSLLVLEDLHWIDAASAEVLSDLLTGVPGLRLLVLTTQRPGWTAPWSEWGWPERVVLRPLRPAAAAGLTSAVLGGVPASPQLERYVLDRSGGNPLFVEELLLALQVEGGLTRSDGEIGLVSGTAERLPSTLREILLARLDQLERQVRKVAQVASVIGRNFAIQLLANVAEHDGSVVEKALLRLQREEVIYPSGDTDLQYAFKHALVREVAYSTLLHKRRQALHAATARALVSFHPDAKGEHVDLIAYHYARTEEHMEAAEWLERAGDRAAAMYANESALAYYAEARNRLEILGASPARLASVDEKRGKILRVMTRHDDAAQALEGAAYLYQQENDLEGEGRVGAELAALNSDRSTPEKGLARIKPIVERLEHELGERPDTAASPALAALYVERQRLLFLNREYDASQERGEQAESFAQGVSDPRLRAKLLARSKMVLGAALLRHSEPERSLQKMEEALENAKKADDPEILYLALRFFGLVCLYQGRLEESGDAFREALQVTRKLGDRGGAIFHMATLGLVEFHLGHWRAARQLLQQAVEESQQVGPSLFSSYPLRWLGQLSLAEGRWDEASKHLEDAVSMSDQGRILQPMRPPESLVAERDLLEGNPDVALSRMDPLQSSPHHDKTGLLPYLAWTHLELYRAGKSDGLAHAAELVQQGVDLAREQNHQLALVDALRIQAMVLTEERRWAEAERSAQEALAQAQRMHDPYAQARVLFEYGRMLLAKEDMDQARGRLSEALAIFQNLGARPYVERTEQALKEL